MRPFTLVVAGLFFAPLVVAAAAQAQVTGIVTESTASLVFRPDVNGVPIRQDYSGNVLSDSSGDANFGSGASFASTSNLAPGVVEFKNGNASAGMFVYSTSRTLVDISFTNDGERTVRPTLHSTIAPAGLGLFVAGDCQSNVAGCSIDDSFAGDFRTFDDFNGSSLAPVTDAIAGASFSFRIIGNGVTLYELKGSVTLTDDPNQPLNILSSDLGAAAAALNGFTMQTVAGSRNEYGFGWDATDIDVAFAPGTLLAPGDSATLTYETIVDTYSRADCFKQRTAACLVAYSSFGDPVGRGGGASPNLMANARLAAASSGVAFQAFDFAKPTFVDGTLSYTLLPSTVPEPANWAMMLAGLGLVGGVMRRRRTVVAA